MLCRNVMNWGNSITTVGFFRHSPLAGANDEKSRFICVANPGLRLLRSLTLGYHVSPYGALEWKGVISTKHIRYSSFTSSPMLFCSWTTARTVLLAVPGTRHLRTKLAHRFHRLRPRLRH